MFVADVTARRVWLRTRARYTRLRGTGGAAGQAHPPAVDVTLINTWINDSASHLRLAGLIYCTSQLQWRRRLSDKKLGLKRPVISHLSTPSCCFFLYPCQTKTLTFSSLLACFFQKLEKYSSCR